MKSTSNLLPKFIDPLRIAVYLCGLALAVSAPYLPAQEAAPKERVPFRLHRVGSYRGEVCDVADFNNDGKLDIVAGEYIYLAPDFTPVKIRSITTDIDESGKGYNWDFMNAPLDVDGDGLVDIVSCSWFGKQIEWYRNTWDLQRAGMGAELWPVTIVHQNGNYECG
ncbi:MAG: VCBS repeat-containing protein, partial [Pirellulales bacterium]|nr:VCBS repeat-containing protein [Pirellulales bacterium]